MNLCATIVQQRQRKYKKCFLFLCFCANIVIFAMFKNYTGVKSQFKIYCRFGAFLRLLWAVGGCIAVEQKRAATAFFMFNTIQMKLNQKIAQLENRLAELETLTAYLMKQHYKQYNFSLNSEFVKEKQKQLDRTEKEIERIKALI